MAILGIMGVLAALACGRDPAKPPLMPTSPRPPGLTPQQKQKMYAVRVTDARDAGIDPKTRAELEWPSKSDIAGKLYKDVTAERLPTLILKKWLPNFIKLPEGTKVRVMLEKGQENMYCLLDPPKAPFRLRLWREPFNKTVRRAQRIDILAGVSVDDPVRQAALSEMLSLKDAKPARLADLTSVGKILKMFPLQESFIALPWTTGGVSKMFDSHVVRLECKVGGPRRPLLMRLYVGDKDMQVSIEGPQLQGLIDPDRFEPLRPDRYPLPDLSPAAVARVTVEKVLEFLPDMEENNPTRADDGIHFLGLLGAEHPELVPMILKGLAESRARVIASETISERDKRAILSRQKMTISELRKKMDTAPATRPATMPADVKGDSAR